MLCYTILCILYYARAAEFAPNRGFSGTADLIVLFKYIQIYYIIYLLLYYVLHCVQKKTPIHVFFYISV